MFTFPTMFLKAMTSAIEANEASAITISHRMPMLASLSFWPSPENILEANRMVVEKFEAVLEGSFAASRQMAELGLQTALGRANPGDIATGLVAVAVAAAKPAQRRVKANAKRLSKH